MKTVSANGVSFSYLEKGTGPLVLLVHGFPDTAHTWDATLDAVAAAGYRAVAYNQRGYAPTAVAPDGKYDSETLGRDAIAMIDALGAEKAVVVGHDWGASAAYCAALLAPEKVRLMVTMAIPYPASVKPTPKILWALRHFFVLRRKSAVAKMQKDDFALVDELYKRWSPEWNEPPSALDDVKACFRDPAALEGALSYYRQLTVRIPKLMRQKITVPAVSFAGESDMLPPRAYEKARHFFTNSYEVVQMPGGHFMHREHPEHFTRELVRVLRDKAPGAS